MQQVLSGLNCDTGELDRAGTRFWNLLTAELKTAAALTADAHDIAARRLAFETLSDKLWLAVSTFESRAGATVRRFHCPMAMDGAGAYWLQGAETVANPYYGAAMLRCGSQVEVLR